MRYQSETPAQVGPYPSRRGGRPRRGIFIVWCAFLLVVLIGMVGLVIDGGLLMAAYRHAQNAADAAAMAAAMEILRDSSTAVAEAAGTTFVTDPAHNDLPDATVTINIPPLSGPYAGSSRYAEALVTTPTPTFFIHVLPGIDQGSVVNARAVAGTELVSLGKGVIALDPNAFPGLKIGGQAQLKINGDVTVNSEGGGVDENGDVSVLDNKQTAATVSNNGILCAANLDITGGVNPNGLDNIENIVDGGPHPLHANQPPDPDPLLYLATPNTSNGVVDTFQGEPQASNGGLALNPGASTDNFIRNDGTPEAPDLVMVLHPGIYTSIKVTGGQVEFLPGIYVLKPAANTSFSLEITGGDVTAQGIMFYNTGDNYQAATGAPDASDYTLDPNPPPPPDGAHFADMKINDSVSLLPLDTSNPAYDYSAYPAEISAFDNMLFYQRRQSDARMQIEGGSADGYHAGTVYAKWGHVKLDGQGTFDGAFVVGEIEAEGQGSITINVLDDALPKAPQVFLVE